MYSEACDNNMSSVGHVHTDECNAVTRVCHLKGQWDTASVSDIGQPWCCVRGLQKGRRYCFKVYSVTDDDKGEEDTSELIHCTSPVLVPGM
jgi:hypothetical protein